jgi:hypothetical protein
MRIDLDDHDDWAKVGRRSPDQGGRPPRFQHSKLFTTKNASRGAGMRVHLPEGAPRCVFSMGHTQRRGIGGDSRTAHRNHLRGQANYNGLDGKLGQSLSFDKDGELDERVWSRVEAWEGDKRYFRASLNPLNHDEIKDWQRFGREFMETFQNGSHHTFDPAGGGMHWHADGILTDEDRTAGNHLDWVMSVHRETGRTHTHVLIRGMVGDRDLYIDPEAVKQFWMVGSGVASMPHHVGMQIERSPEIEKQLEQTIRHEVQMEDRAMRRRLALELEVD